MKFQNSDEKPEGIHILSNTSEKTTSTMHVWPPGKAQEIRKAIKDSAKQLSRSERGQQTLKDFRAMLRNGAIGLDEKNMTALCILVESVRTGFTGSVFEAIAEQLRQVEEKR